MAAALDTNAVSRLEKEGRYAEALALCESADESAAWQKTWKRRSSICRGQLTWDIQKPRQRLMR